MTVCRFFAMGTCRNGNACSYQHIMPQNKWGGSTTVPAGVSKYNESSLKTNLTEERPQWKLSVYGPAKEEPNLVVGVDRSPEEDRLLYYQSMRTTGNNSQYIASHEQLFNQAETQINAIISNPSGAIQHFEKQKANHSGPFGGAANNAPFAPFTNASGAFGSTATTSAFGGGGSGAFGSAGGVSAFGQPSAFGAAKPSAFGSTSTLGGGSAFGSTSALGGGSAFGSTSALGGGSAFGQPSAFGAAASKPSAFGSTSALGGGSAFGSTSALGSGSAFGSTSALGGGAFGTSTPAPAFGATSGLGTAAPTSAFGSTSTLGNSGGVFGQPSAFGSSTNATGAFGSNTTTNAFGSAPTPATNNVPNTMNTGGPPADVNQSALEAFQAPQFTYRAIPEVEPPVQLR